MKKKPPVSPTPRLVPSPRRSVDSWHNGAAIEISLYAKSLHTAAKLLLDGLSPQPTLRTAWEVGPIITLYRHAMELEMKLLVGEGNRFLPSPTDHLTLHKTHSLRWLAQIICSVIKAVQWQAEFTCEGVSNLTEFSALIAELESMDPISAAISADHAQKSFADVPPQLRRANLLEIVPKLDALIHLLAATADGLAATALLMELDDHESGAKPAVH